MASAQLWTVDGLSAELGLDRRTIDKRLDGLPPDHITGKSRK